MGQRRERPAGLQPHGPSKVDLLAGDQPEDTAGHDYLQRPVVVAAIPTDTGEVRVALNERGGKVVIDLRAFDRVTPAKVLMPTGRALTVPIDLAEDVAAAIADAWNAAFDRGLI